MSGADDQNRSIQLAQQGRHTEALEYATRAVQQFERDLRSSDAAALYLGKAMINRCRCLVDCGRMGDALRYSTAVLDHYDRWVATMPQMRPDLALLHSWRAVWLHSAGDHAAAVDSWGKAVAQWVALVTVKYDVPVLQLTMPDANVCRSTLADTLRSFAEALYAHRREHMAAALDATYPYEALTGYPVSRLDFVAARELQEAELLHNRGDIDGAVLHLNLAAAHHLRLFLIDYHQGAGLIAAYFNLLNIYAKVDNDPERALEAAKLASGFGREIHAKDPRRYATLYANTLQWQAELLRATGRHAETATVLEQLRRVAPNRQGP